MKIPFFGKERESFGLDIGSSAIKIVQLRREHETVRLAALAIVPLPPQAITDSGIKDASTVIEAIREAVIRAGVQTTDACIAICGRELIVKKVQIPEVPAREVHDVIQLEAEHHVPFAIDEVFLDHHVLGTHEGTMDVLLVAAKRSKVVEYMRVVEEAGLTPVVVDIDGFALGNQFELNEADGGAEAVALIDLGASVMKTNVVRQGATIFARDIHFGGNHYTQAIAQNLKIPLEQAEAAKLGHDVGVSWDAMVPALEAVSRDLAVEVQRSLDYFASTAETDRIAKIVLAGGGAQLAGLGDYLSATWGLPVDLARPFHRVEVDAALADEVAAAGPSLAVAAGLGLRRPGDRDA
jgi:type IV pilus assembly protein PilM